MSEDVTNEDVERFRLALTRSPKAIIAAALCYCRHYKLTIAQTVALFAMMSLKDLVASKPEGSTSYFDPSFMSEVYAFYQDMVQSVPPKNVDQVLTSALAVEYRLYIDILTSQFDADREGEDDE